MAREAHDFAVSQVSRFKQAADAFVPEVMKAEIFDACTHHEPPETLADRSTIAPHVENTIIIIDSKGGHFFQDGQRFL